MSGKSFPVRSEELRTHDSVNTETMIPAEKSIRRGHMSKARDLHSPHCHGPKTLRMSVDFDFQ